MNLVQGNPVTCGGQEGGLSAFGIGLDIALNEPGLSSRGVQTGGDQMKKLRTSLAAAVLVSAGAMGSAQSQAEELTLCWAAWDPANALAELSKDFTAESGIDMNFEFVPWTNFADRFINERGSAAPPPMATTSS
jgi:hypothetical protein